MEISCNPRLSWPSAAKETTFTALSEKRNLGKFWPAFSPSFHVPAFKSSITRRQEMNATMLFKMIVSNLHCNKEIYGEQHLENMYISQHTFYEIRSIFGRINIYFEPLCILMLFFFYVRLVEISDRRSKIFFTADRISLSRHEYSNGFKEELRYTKVQEISKAIEREGFPLITGYTTANDM